MANGTVAPRSLALILLALSTPGLGNLIPTSHHSLTPMVLLCLVSMPLTIGI